jgi:hypothetical protein
LEFKKMDQVKKNLSRQASVWLTAVLIASALAIGAGLSRKAHAQERTQTFYASQFQGTDKGTKVNNALAQCTNPTLTCIVIVDSILGSFPAGPAYNATGAEIVIDYSVLGLVGYTGPTGTLAIGGNGNMILSGSNSPGIFPASPGLGSLGSLAFPLQTIVIGDTNGRTRWLSGCCTGTRTLSTPDGNSSTAMPASLTTTAATTDNVAVQGMTASGHCMLEPTNSAAAAGIASVFVSAKATNQITVTHTATSGWTFDVLCTAQ